MRLCFLILSVFGAGLIPALGQTLATRPRRDLDLSRIPSQIRGVAANEAGIGVAGAVINVIQVSDSKGLVFAGNRTVISGQDGSFSFENLAAGVWKACGVIADSRFLDPCEWGSPTVFEVTQGQVLMGVRVLLRTGQKIFIRVEDSEKKLKVKADGKKDSEVEIGVWEQKRFHRAKRLGEDVGGEYHLLVVPFARSLQLAVKGKDLEFDLDTDDKKADIKNGGDAVHNIQLAAGQGPKNIKLVARAPKK